MRVPLMVCPPIAHTKVNVPAVPTGLSLLVPPLRTPHCPGVLATSGSMSWVMLSPLFMRTTELRGTVTVSGENAIMPLLNALGTIVMVAAGAGPPPPPVGVVILLVQPAATTRSAATTSPRDATSRAREVVLGAMAGCLHCGLGGSSSSLLPRANPVLGSVGTRPRRGGGFPWQ